MGKCVFFDADGTLLDLKEGIAPDVLPAFQKLKENGHTVVLCTGRARCLIPPEVEALPFDGVISNMGAYIEYQGQPVYQVAATPETARRAVDIIRQGGMVPVMEGDRYMYYDVEEYTSDIDWFAPYITQMLGESHRQLTGNEDCLSVNKISAKRMPSCREEWVCEQLEQDFEAVQHDKSGICGRTVEMVLKGHSKGDALRWLSRYIGVLPENTVAFGDSNNDLSMIQAAHIGVAMGNATPGLKEAADYVTAPLFEQGISKGLAHLGLI